MKEIFANEGVDTQNLGRIMLIGAGLILLTIAVYLPALDSLMVADDFLIVDRLSFDDAIRSLHDTVGFGRNEYRPAIAFSYALSNWLWHGTLRCYHFDSVLLHSINVVLLFSWLLLLTRSAVISGMAAMIFAVHPINVERVAWITARDCLISTLFALLALIAYTLARRRDDGESRIFAGLSVAFFILSLLCYEGSTVLPGIIIALEFFIFAQPGQEFRSRLRMALVKVRWYMIALFIYLAWWAFLFRCEIGQYNASYAPGNVFHNYCRLLYHLFHGNAHLAGVLYFGLLFTVFLMSREHRLLAAFSLAFILLTFLPFMFSAGFAPRFAYASAPGYATLIALMICTFATLKKARAGFGLVAIVFIILAGYYVISLRAGVSDWVAAGQIADSIPRQIKAIHPDLPNGAKLVLAGIPRMHGKAFVYPLGLESSIERFYPNRNFRVIYGPGEMSRIIEEAKPQGLDIFYFTYISARQRIEEITPPIKQ